MSGFVTCKTQNKPERSLIKSLQVGGKNKSKLQNKPRRPHGRPRLLLRQPLGESAVPGSRPASSKEQFKAEGLGFKVQGLRDLSFRA